MPRFSFALTILISGLTLAANSTALAQNTLTPGRQPATPATKTTTPSAQQQKPNTSTAAQPKATATTVQQPKAAAPASAPAAAKPAAPAAAQPAAKPGIQQGQGVAQSSAQKIPETSNTAPRPPAHVLFRPNYLTADIAHFAGLAFRARSERSGQHYLVASHTAFGPGADLQEQLSPDQIATVIVAAVGVSVNDPGVLVTAKPYVMFPEAHVADDTGCDKDIAMFNIPGSSPQDPALVLDEAAPIKGDKVWVYVKYPGTPKTGLEPASIVWISDKEFRYHFDNQGVNISNCMGAPVLTPDGLVVGMHIGTFKSKSGFLFGFACPSAAMRKVMDGAAPAKPKKSLLGGG